MPLDGSGNAQLLPGATNAAPLTKIKSQSQHNDLWLDTANMISAKVDADGRKAFTAPVSGVAATAPNHIAVLSQIISLSITRSEIDSTRIILNAFFVSGETALGDAGKGALYIRGTAGGPRAIQDASGTWFNLAPGDFLIPGHWGARPFDATFDNTAAFQAMADYGAGDISKPIVAYGKFLIRGTITIKGNGGGIWGGGPFATEFWSDQATNDIITFQVGPDKMQCRDFLVRRTVAPNFEVCGIRTPTSGYAGVNLRNIISRGSWYGFLLGSASDNSAYNLVADYNVSHGIAMRNGAGTAHSCQWVLGEIYSGNNGGRGIDAAPNPAAVVGMPIGELRNYRAFGNTGYAHCCIDIAACPIQSVRIYGMFAGQDGDTEIYWDVRGTDHFVVNAFLELTGTYTTGPNNTTPASNIGHGMFFGANCNVVNVISPKINGSSYSGIYSRTSRLNVTNPVITNNGLNTTLSAFVAFNSGIYVETGILSLNGGRITGTGGATQKNGIFFEQDVAHRVTSCDLSGNDVAAIGSLVQLTNIVLEGNSPERIRSNRRVMPQTRLSLSATDPLPPGNLTAQTAVYLQPYVGGTALVRVNTGWAAIEVTAAVLNTLTNALHGPAAVAPDSTYDLFTWLDATDTLRLHRTAAWVGNTPPATTTINGIEVNTAAIPNGPAAGRGVYYGTIRTNSAGTVDWNFDSVDTASTPAIVGIWNRFNAVDLDMEMTTSTGSWTPPVTVQPRNNSANARADVVSGRRATACVFDIQQYLTHSVVSSGVDIGLGIDSTSVITRKRDIRTQAAGGLVSANNVVRVAPFVGPRKLYLLEQASAAGATCYGSTSHTSVRWQA